MHIDRRHILAGAGSAVALSLIGRRASAQTPPAPAAPPPLSVFATLPLIDHIALSPDGQRIAFITQSGDVKVLGWVDLSTKASQTHTFGPVEIRDLFWADNTRVVVVDVHGAGPVTPGGDQAVIVDLETRVITRLFQGELAFRLVESNLGRIKVGDQYFVTASTWSVAQGAQVLWRFDPSLRVAPHMIDDNRQVEGWALDPAGFCVGYSALHDSHNGDARIWSLYWNASPKDPPDYRKIFSASGEKRFPELVGLGRDGKSLLLHFQPEDGLHHYCEVTPDGTVSDPLEAADRSDATPLFHPVSRALAGFSYDDDRVTYDYFDLLMKKLVASVPQIIGEEYRFTLVDFAEDPRKMIVYGESAADAGSYFFIDFSTGNGLPVNSDYPDLPAAWIAEKRPLTYKAADGLDIHGYLTLPPGKPAKALPLIVLPHGGWAARDHGDFDWTAQAFASRGYAVLQPNIRGSSGYGPAFLKAGYGEWTGKRQGDLVDGIQALAAQGIVDAGRVAVFGTTALGGYAALAAAVFAALGTYRCAISVAGVSDIRAMLDSDIRKDEIGANSLAIQLEKTRLGDPARYDDMSPVRQAARATCPVLLIHGADDGRLSIDQGRRMERALKDAGKTVKFVTLQDDIGWEDMSSARIAMITAAMDFITQYNPA